MFNIPSFMPSAIFGDSRLTSNEMSSLSEGFGNASSSLSQLGTLFGSRKKRNRFDRSAIDKRYGQKMDDLKRQQQKNIGRSRSRALKSGFALSGSAADVLSSRVQQMEVERDKVTDSWDDALKSQKVKAMKQSQRHSSGTGGFEDTIKELSDLFKVGEPRHAMTPPFNPAESGEIDVWHTTFPNYPPSTVQRREDSRSPLKGYEGRLFRTWESDW